MKKWFWAACAAMLLGNWMEAAGVLAGTNIGGSLAAVGAIAAVTIVGGEMSEETK